MDITEYKKDDHWNDIDLLMKNAGEMDPNSTEFLELMALIGRQINERLDS